MKVRIAVTLDIDPEMWGEVYGVPPADVRADVQRWAASAITEHARDVGVLADAGRD